MTRFINYTVFNEHRRYLANKHVAWKSANHFDFTLLLLAFILMFLATLMMFAGGAHAGFDVVHAVARDFLPDVIWEHLSFSADTMVVLSILLFFSIRFPHITIAALISAIVGTLIVHGTKGLLELPRPPAVLDPLLLDVIGPAYKAGSMPSGHTATAFIFAGLVVRCVKRAELKIMILVFAALMGWSRVACGVHWPIDVLIGAAVGLFSAWCGLYVADRIVIGSAVYFSICLILITAAIMLFSFTGGFLHTWFYAKALSLLSLTYWISFGVLLLSQRYSTDLAIDKVGVSENLE